jgi:hypothetical protein
MNVGKKNFFVSPNENFISLHESFAAKSPRRIILQLPSQFDNTEFVGRVYMIRITWSFFDCEVGFDPDKQSDVINPQTAELKQDFVFDTTWKYRIEPYDPLQPEPVSIPISETWPYTLDQTLEETKNQIIYDIDIPKNHYTVCRMDVELSSVYPKVQSPCNFYITVTRLIK